MPENHLLMIPGPIEISARVAEAAALPPLGHTGAVMRRAMADSLDGMRKIWGASADSQPFIVAGSGTLAMEMAAQNVLSPGEKALVVNTGVFGSRMAEMLARRGVQVHQITPVAGCAPALEEVASALNRLKPQALFATHVDTSTGVRCDPEGLARLATEAGALSVFDGVCATAAEVFEMEAWGCDVYYSASQKAIGLPAGLALSVVSKRAMERREQLAVPPSLSIDWQEWTPIMQAYEADRPAYFSTPATTLVRALAVGLDELLEEGSGPRGAREAITGRHREVADRLRAAWEVLGLSLVPERPEWAANTLSALRFPEGIGPELVAEVGKRGVVIAGGLHPDLKGNSFRVGHMGEVTKHPDQLARCVSAIGEALSRLGHPCDTARAEATVRG